jgi:uncharacterized protein YkwD
MVTSGFFSHTGPGGNSPATRIARYYRGSRVGEVIFWQEPRATPEQAIATWLASAAHRRIALGSAFRQVGIAAVHMANAPGVYGGRNVTVVVADFGAP